MVEYQKDYCKKCGAEGFYFPINKKDMNGTWDMIDNYQKMVAFDPTYRVPHYAVCKESKYPDKSKVLREQLEHEGLTTKPDTGAKHGLLSKFESTPFPKNLNEWTPLSQLEKDITEIKATLKTAVAMLEWIQQQMVSKNVTHHDGSMEPYRD